MRALILAATHPGSDFEPAALPGCLYSVHGQPLLDQMVAALRAAGVGPIRLVLGYEAAEVRRHCLLQGESLAGLEIGEAPFWSGDAVAGLERGLGGLDEDLLLVSQPCELSSELLAGLLASPARRPAWYGNSALVRLPGGRLGRHGIFAAARARAGRWLRDSGEAASPGSARFLDAAIATTLAEQPDTVLLPSPGPWTILQRFEQTDESGRPAAPAPDAVHPPCTVHTARCDFWEWGPEAVRPDCCTAHMREMLVYTDDLLTRHGIFHWLDYGPLLGAVREGGFIAWDYDVDFSVLLEDRRRIAALRDEIAAAGHSLTMREDHIWRIFLSPNNHNHADLFPWHLEDGQLHLGDVWAETGPFPPRWLDRLEPVRLFGREFLAPAPVEEFLATHRYGADYMTPRRYAEPLSPIAKIADSFLARQQARERHQADIERWRQVLDSTRLAARYLALPGGTENTNDAAVGFRAAVALPSAALPDLESALAALAVAGFEPRWRYRDTEGRLAAVRFKRGNAAFDLMLADAFDETADDPDLRYDREEFEAGLLPPCTPSY